MPLHVGRRTIVVQTTIYSPDGKRAALVTQTQLVICRSERHARAGVIALECRRSRRRLRGGGGMAKPVSFYSEGVRLAGDLFLPDDLRPGEKRAGIVLCHGYTGVRNLTCRTSRAS